MPAGFRWVSYLTESFWWWHFVFSLRVINQNDTDDFWGEGERRRKKEKLSKAGGLKQIKKSKMELKPHSHACTQTNLAWINIHADLLTKLFLCVQWVIRLM